MEGLHSLSRSKQESDDHKLCEAVTEHTEEYYDFPGHAGKLSVELTP